MLITIDVGNTNTVIGLYDGTDPNEASAADEGLLDNWRISTDHDRTPDELAVLLGGFLGFRGTPRREDVQGVAISSGVPRSTATLRAMTKRYFGVEPVVIEPGIRGIAPDTAEKARAEMEAAGAAFETRAEPA